MQNEYFENIADDDIYDSIFGIKLKGLFKKKDKSAGESDRPKDGTRFKNILSGLGSAAQSGAGIYAGMKASKQSKSHPAATPAAAAKNNTPYYIIGGVVGLIIIIVIIVVAVKK